MGASLTALLGYDVTDPRSPHSVHVASEADVPAVAPWGHAVLCRAVRLADDHDATVVLDHDRERLYLARPDALEYRRPGALGLGTPPALVVTGPAHLRPAGEDLVVEPFDPALLSAPAPEWPESGSAAATDAPSDAGRGADDPPSVTVSPTFDVLVPAFDIEEQGEPAEPLLGHSTESPTGVGTGTPSG
jgi:hypothetical protein